MGKVISFGKNSGAEAFLVPAGNRRLSWRCMEDRPGEATGLQIAGSIAGIAAAQTISMEVQRPGSYIASGVPIGNFEALLEKLGSNHEACAGRGSMAAILQTLAGKPGGVHRTANQLRSTSRDDAHAASKAAGRLLESGLVVIEKPKGVVVPLGPRHRQNPNKPAEHAAASVLAIHDRPGGRLLLDTHAAWENDTPYYGLNVNSFDSLDAEVGRALDAVDMLLGDTLERVNPKLLAINATLYSAATIENLPRPGGPDVPLEIISVGEVA